MNEEIRDLKLRTNILLMIKLADVISALDIANQTDFKEVVGIFTRDELHVSLVSAPFGLPLNVLRLNSTTSLIRDTNTVTAGFSKRFPWFAFAAVWKIAETGIGMWQLITACQDWSNGDNGATAIGGCIYGVISTLVAIARAAWAGYSKTAETKKYLDLIRSFSGAVSKRDNPLIDVTAWLALQNSLTNITQLEHTMLFSNDGLPLYSSRIDGAPLFLANNSVGVPVLGSLRVWNNGTHDLGSIYHSFLNLTMNSERARRDEQFNEQDFTLGGLEMTFLFNEADNGVLLTQDDYGTIDHQVSCELSDLLNNMFAFQWIDFNNKGTISGGNGRAFTDEPYGEEDMDHITLGLWPRDECEVD
ncbi:hypothetical protein Cantr_07619 [Candida viswanathii]|uniref:Uncharacterized protein n=1 Tax=Candida viswanathii TaxID=5486 RepID=A0A367XZM9_9ASCO|nr:hypothetical protein Cantr_07619 [Candida viswanathii]